MDGGCTGSDAAREGCRLRGLGCAFVYLDVGSNQGDSIEAFMASSAEMDPFLDELLSRLQERRPSTACVQGFEPNPHWTVKLNALETLVNADGRLRSLRIHTMVALTADRPARNLWLNVGSDNNAVGASVSSGRVGGVEVQVAYIRVDNWVYI